MHHFPDVNKSYSCQTFCSISVFYCLKGPVVDIYICILQYGSVEYGRLIGDQLLLRHFLNTLKKIFFWYFLDTFFGYFWDTLRKLDGYFEETWRILLGYFWDTFDIIYDTFQIILEIFKILFSYFLNTFLGYFWYKFGILFGYFWGLFAEVCLRPPSLS